MRLITILCLGAVACAAAVASPASAQVQPAGTGEPAFTNSTQNTQWFEWPASLGADAYRVRFDFSDDVAGPFPANFLCFQVGGGPQGVCDKSAGMIYGHNPACSVPAGAGRATTFSCTADYGAVPDGTVWACVIAADASIPDNPSSSNQSSTADKANLSDPSCDGVVVDRTPPPVAIGVASASVNVGDVVSLTASATDATSGLGGAAEWTWGDNTGGELPSRCGARPGTARAPRRALPRRPPGAHVQGALSTPTSAGGVHQPPDMVRPGHEAASVRLSPPFDESGGRPTARRAR